VAVPPPKDCGEWFLLQNLLSEVVEVPYLSLLMLNIDWVHGLMCCKPYPNYAVCIPLYKPSFPIKNLVQSVHFWPSSGCMNILPIPPSRTVKKNEKSRRYHVMLLSLLNSRRGCSRAFLLARMFPTRLVARDVMPVIFPLFSKFPTIFLVHT